MGQRNVAPFFLIVAHIKAHFKVCHAHIKAHIKVHSCGVGTYAHIKLQKFSFIYLGLQIL